MRYDRRIKYLDYLENGERVRGCGFARLELRDSHLIMDLNIRGLRCAEGLACDVILCSQVKEAAVGKITFYNGEGKFRHECHVENEIGKTGIAYQELSEIRIRVGEGRLVSCTFRENERGEAELNAAEQKNVAETAGQCADEECGEPEAGQQRENPQEVKRLEPESRQERNLPEASDQPPRMTEQPQGMRGRVQTEPEPATIMSLQEDKWRQLCTVYPHVNPFGDEREYLSVGPADFVLFSADSYRAANNSFLLHGFYNYGHLILTRVERKGEILYYLGVPGNYFEREKQVAVMFGFESFECAQEPAQASDFGYYMMKVQM